MSINQALNDFNQKHPTSTALVTPSTSSEQFTPQEELYLKKRRCWCITSHVWTKKGETEIRIPNFKYKLLRYIIGANEYGEKYILEKDISTKKLMEISNRHHQVYAEFTEGVTWKQGKLGLYNDSAHESHWEPRQGTQAQAIRYCTKDYVYNRLEDQGTWKYGKSKAETGEHISQAFEYGTKAAQGVLDLSWVKAAIENGATEQDVLIEYCEMGYKLSASLFSAVERAFQKFTPIEAYVRQIKETRAYSGPSGHGKTSMACAWLLSKINISWSLDKRTNDINIAKYIYIIGPTMRIDDWTTYRGQKLLLIDDATPETVPFKTLLSILYDPVQQNNAKYGHRYNLAEYIAFTSVDHFTDLYRSYCSANHEDLTQLTRRFTSSRNVYSETLALAPQQDSATPINECSDHLFSQQSGAGLSITPAPLCVSPSTTTISSIQSSSSSKPKKNQLKRLARQKQILPEKNTLVDLVENHPNSIQLDSTSIPA